MKPSFFLSFIGLTLALFLGTACEESVVEPPTDLGYGYFPMAVGDVAYYEMDSIVLRKQVGGVLFDSIRLEVEERLTDTLRDAAGELWYRGERYDRRMGSEEWRFRQSFLLRRDEQRAYRQEDNLEFVKLTFPLSDNGRWDGHVAFDEERIIEVAGEPIKVFLGWDYRYLAVGEPGSAGGLNYDEVVEVEGADYETLLNRRLALETYANGIGLIYREMEVFETQCQFCCSGNTGECLDLPWRAKAEGGFIIRQWRVE